MFPFLFLKHVEADSSTITVEHAKGENTVMLAATGHFIEMSKEDALKLAEMLIDAVTHMEQSNHE